MTKIVLNQDKLPKGKTDWKALRDKPDSEVVKAARADPDARPLAPTQIERLLPVVDVKALRKKLGMTQVAFCSAFKLSPGTVRDWEQHRFIPDGPARVLLTVIERDADAVIRALREPNKTGNSKSGGKIPGVGFPRKPKPTVMGRKKASA